MVETNEKDIGKLAKEFGGYKQIAFWNKFINVIYCVNQVIIALCMIGGIVFGIDNIDGGDFESGIRQIVISIIGAAIFMFIAYVLLMFVRLLLSYFYDIKQQRITLENLTLMEGGELLDNRNLTEYATKTALKSMNLNSSDLEK